MTQGSSEDSTSKETVVIAPTRVPAVAAQTGGGPTTVTAAAGSMHGEQLETTKDGCWQHQHQQSQLLPLQGGKQHEEEQQEGQQGCDQHAKVVQAQQEEQEQLWVANRQGKKQQKRQFRTSATAKAKSKVGVLGTVWPGRACGQCYECLHPRRRSHEHHSFFDLRLL